MKKQQKENPKEKRPTFPILGRDELRSFFSDFTTTDAVYNLRDSLSQRGKYELAFLGCFALPVQILLFFTGGREYNMRLSGTEVSEMVGLAKIITDDELWDRCDPMTQLEIRTKLSRFQTRFASNAFMVRK